MNTVLITGGTRGIGKGLVEKFHRVGCKVIFFYLNSVDEARVLTETFSNVYAYRCDVSKEESVIQTVKMVMSEHENIDVLINNAAVSFEGLLHEMSLDEWNKVISNDLTSVFLMCRAVIPHFVSKKHGKIINISSMWGSTGASCEVAYSAAKAGVDGFTKALAKELAPCGITVNAIAPGVIMTDMLSCYSEEDLKQLCNDTPLMRIGTPDDVASAALYLSSDGADFVTGQIINVNGGYVI